MSYPNRTLYPFHATKRRTNRWSQQALDHYVQRRHERLASGKAKFRRWALKKVYTGVWRRHAKYGGYTGKYLRKQAPKRVWNPRLPVRVSKQRNKKYDEPPLQALRHLRALSRQFGRNPTRAIRRKQLQLGRALGLNGKQVDKFSRNVNL